MAKRKKIKVKDTFLMLVDFTEAADTIFERLTGKPIASWLKELKKRKELPAGNQAVPSEPVMPLVDAYAVLGLPQAASLAEVKKNYRRLAAIFHPDHQGGYDDAMKLLNNAYEAIQKGGK